MGTAIKGKSDLSPPQAADAVPIDRAGADGYVELGSAAGSETSDFEAAGGIATHAALTATHGVSGAIVGTSDSQTLTNKTINSLTNSVEADAVHLACRNTSGGTLVAGTAVYISGYNGGTDEILVTEADASNSALMPAVGLIESDIANNASGVVVVLGNVTGLNTSAYSAGDALYVSPTTPGTLTTTKPTAAAHLIQSVARVVRAHVNQGAVTVSGAGRSNDVPNSIAVSKLATGAANEGDVLTMVSSVWTPQAPTASGGWIVAPDSPSAYDDEFDAGTLDVSWTADAVLGAGTVDWFDGQALGTSIYDLASVPSWLMMQGYESVSTGGGITKSVTGITTNALFAARSVTAPGLNVSVGGMTQLNNQSNLSQGNVSLIVKFSGGAGNDLVQTYISSQNGAPYAQMASYIVDNGAGKSAVITTAIPLTGIFVLVILKTGDEYHFGVIRGEDAPHWYPIGKYTKTVNTTISGLYIGSQFDDTSGYPRPVTGFDWVRYYPNATSLSVLGVGS